MAAARRLFPRSHPAFGVRGAAPGLSAVELLLACVIAGLALAAAWSWLFSSAAAGGREQRRLEAETSLAFVERLTSAELRRVVQFLASPAPGCSERSVSFVVLDDDGTADTVTYVWNPATRVLWRKAPASHLVSDVASFAIGYLDGDGAVVTPAGGSFSVAELARVRSLRLSLILLCGKGQVEASWCVTPRGTR